jgi:Squalene-hopene cyclase N-terminal domain
MSNDAAAPRPTETPAAPSRKVLVVARALDRGDTGNLMVGLIAAVVSIVAHAVIILLLMNISVGNLDAGATAEDVEGETRIEEPQKEEPDLTNVDLGNDTAVTTQYNVAHIDEISVPGPNEPTASAGLLNAPETAPMTLPPPPGAGNGTGASAIMPDPGTGSTIGLLGGLNGQTNGSGFSGRSGATREKLLQEGGGNAKSEAAVARGLEWLALHQAQGGQWSLDGFNRQAREKPYPEGKNFTDDSSSLGARRNDIAGTAFGLLPFLAAGQTHKAPVVSKDQKAPQKDYHKGVDAGLKFLMSKQARDGYFGGEMYAHCLAAIAMCEAYGMTNDPVLRVSAQKAVNYLVDGQDPAGGGWRYTPRMAGDTSVTGWAVMALRSGQMAGLSVPAATLRKADRFLDSVEGNSKGTYRYLSGNDDTPAMTAAGMLCRLYLGVRPQNAALLAGVEKLKKAPPGITGNLYYEYYATQVMHQMGGESWSFWNQGPDGKSGIRDSLIKRQDQGTSGKKGNAGSWPVTEDFATKEGGRLMATSLSLLTLEVYYRHLPLYRRDPVLVKESK